VPGGSLTSTLHGDAAEPVAGNALRQIRSQSGAESDTRAGPAHCSCGVAAQAGVGWAYNQEAFHYFLEIERKRSELSRCPLLLMLVDVSKQSGVRVFIEPATAKKLFSAMRQGLRETDFIGWYQEGQVAGAVLPQVAPSLAVDASQRVAARLEEVLRRGVPSNIGARVQVRVHDSAASDWHSSLGITRRRPPTTKEGYADLNQFARLHVLNPELFESALIREARRADRSNQRFILLRVSARDGTKVGTAIWSSAIEAVAAGKRHADVMGYFEGRGALGVIVTEIHGSDAAIARELQTRIHRELTRRLGFEAASMLSIKLRAYPHSDDAAEVAPVHGILTPLELPNKRAVIGQALKRGFDIFGSFTLLSVLSPLLALIAVLVMVRSPGPIFFRQVRVGERMKPFTMLKFRTMHMNTDHAIHQAFVTQFIKTGSQSKHPREQEMFKIVNDPRVTPIGRILRRTSIDELPQLWNVLRGDMSLVGPRPPLLFEVEHYERWHRRRVLEAKPGMTGLWQVEGRSRTTFDDMVRLDLRYARTRSMWSDIKILLATPGAVIAGKGAL
jgi:lipopolysaccharide/colanic/teichoic acid biosynthesis glycosyltransferase